ncbi:chitinase-3-like protein 1 [Syngnathus acus]|uniref:chitinase-3-like protein 1 n=1 Tax=Syngnathus acus TaxID=161584 RepID=UPI00188638C6|nr:chitinase-3-like protein 1 [Syngnathus acus]XP_037102207.1 chitinase-3-like protein 1 [Syngnathus acus]
MTASQAAEAKFPAFKGLRNANLKTILEVNLMLRPTIVQDMLVDAAHRLTFIQSAISYLRTHGFDGINILWLNANNGQVTKTHYTSFVQEFRVKINAETNPSGPDALLLTASVASRIVDIQRSYDVVPVATAVDFLNVMTSDMTAYFGQKTPSFQTPGASFQSASFAMTYWKTASALPGKLNMGIGVFGRVFTLDPSCQVEPVQGSLSDLPAGIWSRYEVCSSSASADIWFAFDNQDDIDAKVQFIQSEGLAGAFVVSMDLDDFDGNSCTDTNDLHGPYAVTDRVHAQLNTPVNSPVNQPV